MRSNKKNEAACSKILSSLRTRLRAVQVRRIMIACISRGKTRNNEYLHRATKLILLYFFVLLLALVLINGNCYLYESFDILTQAAPAQKVGASSPGQFPARLCWRLALVLLQSAICWSRRRPGSRSFVTSRGAEALNLPRRKGAQGGGGQGWINAGLSLTHAGCELCTTH